MKKEIRAFEEVVRYMKEDYVSDSDMETEVSKLVLHFLKKELEWMKE